jgi:pantoate--beta-alanine ligase
MRTIRTVAELRAALKQPRQAGRTIGLVPTMGAFHEGHLSLMRRARADCDEVVVSLFINPTQFNESSDLDAYPRDEARDAALAAELGVDYLFAPGVDEVYPSGFSTSVSVAGITEVLEGAYRGQGHFDGVAMIVAKLFNMVAPDVAYFGQKDAQQVTVIQRLVRDLDIPVRIEVCPTVREPDGLAMSSRNVRLSDSERERAAALNRALDLIESAIANGERDAQRALERGRDELRSAEIDPEYLELVAAETLQPISRIEGQMLALVAARIGTTRLIDNHPLSVTDGSASRRVLEVAGSATDNGRP